MTGLQAVSSVLHTVYYLLMLIVVAGFAVYDVKTKRVPNKALVFLAPAALAAPFLNALVGGAAGWGAFVMPVLSSVLGAAMGMSVLLAAALVSKNGCGVGGGDIKLAAILGFIYGVYNIIGIMLIASMFALLFGYARMKKSDAQKLHMAFVPFIAVGCLFITLIGFL